MSKVVLISKHTFHDVDDAADIPFLDDETAGSILHGIHAVHYLADLRHLEVLHEVVVQNGGFDQLPRPSRESLL